MSKTQRVTGNLTVDPTGDFIVLSDTQITGNLTVTGTETSISTTNSTIKDRQIVLNEGEAGAGITGRYAGIEVERGSLANTWLVFDENDDNWKISYDGGSSFPDFVVSSTTGLTTVVDDTSPELGGDLDVNGFNIVSTVSNENIEIIPNGTGTLSVQAAIKLTDQSAPTQVSNSTLIYSAAQTGGGSGVYFVDSAVSGELVSRKKAVLYGLIF
jgi:hypothetical protein|tara:strand:+ start:252 stop:890 length:639 start_codon:yes stop_codon:yes gene_type:complete